MRIATHLIKIKGTFDNKWKEKELRDYVKDKIKEIESFYHTDLELFKVDDNKIEVWVYIHALPSEAKRNIIDKWLKDHIKEEGITIIYFDIEEKFNLCYPKNDPFILIP